MMEQTFASRDRGIDDDDHHLIVRLPCINGRTNVCTGNTVKYDCDWALVNKAEQNWNSVIQKRYVRFYKTQILSHFRMTVSTSF